MPEDIDVETSKVTQHIKTHNPPHARRLDRSFEWFLDKWPLWLAVCGGIVAGIKFYYTVQDLAAAQARWQTGSEARREKDRDIKEADHIKAAVMANDLEWLKKEKR